MVKRSHTAIIEKNVTWQGHFETEPFEAGWAAEAVYFIRSLRGDGGNAWALLQISADGMHWVDEGVRIALPHEGRTTFGRTVNFGSWLRLVGEAERPVTVIVSLALKE
jgi:hypothetical protein